MNPKLSVEIGADVKELENALKRASQLLSKFEGEHRKVLNAISQSERKTEELTAATADLTAEAQKGAISEAKYAKEIERLNAELSQVQKETAEYQNEIKRLDKEIDRVSVTTAQYSKSTENSVRHTDRAAASVSRLGTTARVNATPAMLSFSQTIQDAPYGMMGMANNITMLTEQFGYLKTATGSAKGALTAMLATLSGPAGIALGVSLVTTLLVSFGDQLFSTKSKAEELKTAQDKLNTSLETYVANLEAANKAELEGAQDSVSRLTTLQLLKRQLDDTTNSEAERLAAFREIQKLYPSIFKNIKDETALNEGLGKSYGELTSQLEKKSVANASEDNLVKTRRRLLEVEGQILQTLYTSEEERDKARKHLEATGRLMQSNSILTFATTADAVEYNNLLKEREKLLKDEISLSKQVESFGGVVPLDFEVGEVKTPDEGIDPVRLPVVLEPLGDMDMAGGNTALLKWKMMLEEQLTSLKAAQAYYPVFSAEYKKLAEEIESVEMRLAGPGAQLEASANKALEALTMRNEQARILNEEYLADTTMFANMVGQGFANLSNQMVDSLLAGEFSLESFGKSIISTFAKIANQMIAQAIIEKIIGKTQIASDHGVAMGNAGVMASSAAAAMGPAGIFAFPGLLAAASGMVTGFFGSLQAFADGGVVNGSSYHGDKILARVNSGELILNKDQQRNLYSQLQAPTVMANPTATALDLNLTSLIEGDHIRLVLDRADKSKGRAS